ncbi:MAG: L-2-hydroxyglutarate oxidase [Verrucomicrobiales bacterium]|nr:L-2-hydroxyglutarate oxidase [Verrucomicrobiales bacterium]
MSFDVIVVGGGIVGLSTAWQLLGRKPTLRLLLVEKERALAQHQTGHNSGVLHAGLYYKPGSAKARLAVQGLQQMVAFCRDHGIPFEQCGKIVVARDEAELPRLEALFERGLANGLLGLQKLSRERIKELEPYAAGVAAVHVPQEGIVDYSAVALKLGELIQQAGGEIRCSTCVERLVTRDNMWVVETTTGEFHARFVITCAGLHADRLVRAAGGRPTARIVPFRGEYYKIRKDRQHLVRNLIYPVPDPKFPFLGVHFTRLIGGGVEAGPNAVLAFAREGYSWRDLNLRDLGESVLFPGLWRFACAHPRMCVAELWTSFSKAAFCKRLQRLVPAIQPEDLEPGGAGVRAQAMRPDGTLVEDFMFDEARGILHVLNAPSPAATAALAIGEKIAERVLAQLG